MQNGTTTGGIGRKLKDELDTEGYSVPDLSSAPDQGSYKTTRIIDFTGGKKPHTVDALKAYLGLGDSAVTQEDASKAIIANSDQKPVDILVIAGDDRLNDVDPIATP